ncbi:hypothetical protein ACFYSH_12900 [Streptomyces sp. NPDC005791]
MPVTTEALDVPALRESALRYRTLSRLGGDQELVAKLRGDRVADRPT